MFSRPRSFKSPEVGSRHRVVKKLDFVLPICYPNQFHFIAFLIDFGSCCNFFWGSYDGKCLH